ncbi:MAG: substrate-binding domain-containing protein [Firmicutes bacterium]|nr:substrate-binding domain-containing protein [Bacillota bacterium]
MAVTIQQIAEAAGVSRGTVDRALNNRGRINPEVAQRIRRMADEMGYVRKNRKQVAPKKETIKIGIITQLAKSAFMLEVNRGIRQAAEELKERGIKLFVKEGISVDGDQQLRAMDELVQENIQGLAIMPTDCESVRLKLNWLIEEAGIPVVTFNSDIVGTRRSCYVGMDNRKSGRTAAGLMGMLTGGSGKILVITGFFSNPVNNARVDGFVEELKKSYPSLELAGVQGSFDEASEVNKIITNAMLNIPGINGVFVISGGQKGIGEAYEKLQLERRPYTIIYDLTPGNRDALKNGTADFLIDQEGYVQGYRPPLILAELLLKGKKVEEEFQYTDIKIKTKYNL